MVDNGNYGITANGVMIEEGGGMSVALNYISVIEICQDFQRKFYAKNIFRHACFPVKRHEIWDICIYFVLLLVSNSVTTHTHTYIYACVRACVRAHQMQFQNGFI